MVASTADETVTARVYLIRHGETDANRNGVIQGQVDTVLNATGQEQGRLVAKALGRVPFEVAFSSDLVRASKVSLHQTGSGCRSETKA